MASPCLPTPPTDRRGARSRAVGWWIGPILMLLSAVASPCAAADKPAETRDDGLTQIESLIASGFQKGDAERLAVAFSRRVKTYVACSPLATSDGYYGAEQIRLLLRRMFRGRETVSFRVLEPAARRRPDGMAVLSALWTYRDASAPLTQIRLSFGLGSESGSWRVREIRDLK